MFFPLFLSLPILCRALVSGRQTSPKVATAWYAGWHTASDPAFSLSQVSWDKYTQMTYAFAETTPDVRMVTLNGSEPEMLPKFVATAQANGVKAFVSVGGWTGSLYWSSNVATPQNRTLFVKTMVDFATKYRLDGLDFDWEYPTASGIGCNTRNANDTANFLAFLQELRADPLGSRLILTAAVATSPFADSTGNSADVSGFSMVLDHIAIMNYDISGSWSAAVGANSPLDDSCAPSNFQAGSATYAISAWNDAGMPLDQIVLGVPAYGHSFRVAKSDALDNSGSIKLFAPFNTSNPPVGDAWDDEPKVDACGNLGAQGGVITFWGMIAEGYLNADGTPIVGVPYLFDTCAQTPFVYNTTTEVMIAFDNAQSFAAKGEFIQSNGLAGFAMWEAGGDSNDILLDSIRESAGFSSIVVNATVSLALPKLI